jgi:radical SAM protein (TIGR01212 family)
MRYRVYSDYLRQRYGQKVYKLPVNLPVTCPNRDGTCGVDGCVFCGEVGAGFENLPSSLSVADQLGANKTYIAAKYKAKKFIAYFQNYSNTYMAPAQLENYMQQACTEEIIAIALATRPDCVSDEHCSVISRIREKYNIDVFLELGLQTVNYHTLNQINRGHTLAEFIDAVLRAKRYGIETCAHVIIGLPWDDKTDAVENAKVISALGVEQVKIHALYIVRNTVMAEWYQQGAITLISKDEYIERVIAFLEHLHPDIVVQRLIGRAPEEATLFANWQTGWWKIRDEIEQTMEARQSFQGKHCDYLNGNAVRQFL